MYMTPEGFRALKLKQTKTEADIASVRIDWNLSLIAAAYVSIPESQPIILTIEDNIPSEDVCVYLCKTYMSKGWAEVSFIVNEEGTRVDFTFLLIK